MDRGNEDEGYPYSITEAAFIVTSPLPRAVVEQLLLKITFSEPDHVESRLKIRTHERKFVVTKVVGICVLEFPRTLGS